MAITVKELCVKTARLIEEKSPMTAVNLLKEFNARYVMELKPEQYEAYNSRLDEARK